VVVQALTSGVSGANTVVLAGDATPVIGTDAFVGISAQDAPVGTDTTVDADWVDVVEPIPNWTRLRGKAKTAASVDTLTELIGLLWDVVLFDAANTNTFTIDQTAAADTSGLTIKGGIFEQGLLDVTVDPRAMRYDIS